MPLNFILWLIIYFWSLKRGLDRTPLAGYENNNLLACEWRGHRRALGVHCCVDDLSHKSCTLLKINLDLDTFTGFFMVDQMIKLNICYM